MIEEIDALRSANIAGGVIFFLVCLGIGLLFDLLLLPRLRKFAGHHRWRFVGVMSHSIRGVPTLVALIIGVLGLINIARWSPWFASRAAFFSALLLILMTVLVALRLASGLVHLYLGHHGQRTVSLVNLLIRIFGVVILLSVALTLLDIPIAPLLTVLAGSSLGLSLALRDPLANLFAGLQILAANRVRPGAYVRLSTGEEGYVDDVRWSDTTIRQLSNNIIIVPNSVLTTTLLVDYDQPESEQSIVIPVGVHYGSDLAQVERVTTEVAAAVMREVQGGVPTWQPLVRYTGFGESQITFSVVLKVHSYVDQYLVKHEFVKRLQERYAAEGIIIPFPTLVIAEPQRVARDASYRQAQPEDAA